MSLEDVFKIVVVVFTVPNLGAMGLELNLREALKTLRSARAIRLILPRGWVVGPALAWLINSFLPLADAYAAGLLLISLAPTAPFFPMMVRIARGDMSFGGAFMILTTIGTVLPALVRQRCEHPEGAKDGREPCRWRGPRRRRDACHPTSFASRRTVRSCRVDGGLRGRNAAFRPVLAVGRGIL